MEQAFKSVSAIGVLKNGHIEGLLLIFLDKREELSNGILVSLQLVEYGLAAGRLSEAQGPKLLLGQVLH